MRTIARAKIRTMPWSNNYFMWRTPTGRHTNITYSFLVVGHTKFAPDWSFGLFKRLYQRTKVGSIADIASVVDNSALCNSSQVVCDENGSVTVKSFDWSTYVTGLEKRDLIAHFEKIELLLP